MQPKPRITIWECKLFQSRPVAQSDADGSQCGCAGFEAQLGCHSTGELQQKCCFDVSSTSLAEFGIAAMWPMHPGSFPIGTVDANPRLALWLAPLPPAASSDHGCSNTASVGGELQILAVDSGECLAWLPVAADTGISRIVVPPQDKCPAAVFESLSISPDSCPLVVICECSGSEGSEWIVAVATAELCDNTGCKQVPRPMHLRALGSNSVCGRLSRVQCSNDGLLGCCTANGSGYVLDWQSLQAHPTPDGWQPKAISRSTVILMASERSSVINGAQLLVLEPGGSTSNTK